MGAKKRLVHPRQCEGVTQARPKTDEGALRDAHLQEIRPCLDSGVPSVFVICVKAETMRRLGSRQFFSTRKGGALQTHKPPEAPSTGLKAAMVQIGRDIYIIAAPAQALGKHL